MVTITVHKDEGSVVVPVWNTRVMQDVQARRTKHDGQSQTARVSIRVVSPHIYLRLLVHRLRDALQPSRSRTTGVTPRHRGIRSRAEPLTVMEHLGKYELSLTDRARDGRGWHTSAIVGHVKSPAHTDPNAKQH